MGRRAPDSDRWEKSVAIETRYSVPEEVIGRSLGEDLLVHCFDTDEVFVLNGHARMIFEAIKRVATREEVRDAIRSQGFDHEAALSAVDRTIDELLELKVIVAEPGAQG
jgi:hypothetical protein